MDVSAPSSDASDTSSIETLNESATSSSDRAIQGGGKALCQTFLFDEIVRKLPFDEVNEIKMFNKNMKEPKFLSNTVSL